MIYRLTESLKVSRFKGLKYKREQKELSWEEFMKQYSPETLKKLKSS